MAVSSTQPALYHLQHTFPGVGAFGSDNLTRQAAQQWASPLYRWANRGTERPTCASVAGSGVQSKNIWLQGQCSPHWPRSRLTRGSPGLRHGDLVPFDSVASALLCGLRHITYLALGPSQWLWQRESLERRAKTIPSKWTSWVLGLEVVLAHRCARVNLGRVPYSPGPSPPSSTLGKDIIREPFTPPWEVQMNHLWKVWLKSADITAHQQGSAIL